MAERIQKTKTKTKTKTERKTDKVEAPVERTPEEQAVIDATAELLDEIDSVLEVNAEEFVRGYIQKGGQ